MIYFGKFYLYLFLPYLLAYILTYEKRLYIQVGV